MAALLDMHRTGKGGVIVTTAAGLSYGTWTGKNALPRATAWAKRHLVAGWVVSPFERLAAAELAAPVVRGRPMDPNANLLEQEQLLEALDSTPKRFAACRRAARARLKELRYALKAWLDTGGFAPEWSRAPKASARFCFDRMRPVAARK